MLTLPMLFCCCPCIRGKMHCSLEFHFVVGVVVLWLTIGKSFIQYKHTGCYSQPNLTAATLFPSWSQHLNSHHLYPPKVSFLQPVLQSSSSVLCRQFGTQRICVGLLSARQPNQHLTKQYVHETKDLFVNISQGFRHPAHTLVPSHQDNTVLTLQPRGPHHSPPVKSISPGNV